MRRLNTLFLVLGLFVITGMSAQNLLLNGDFESWDDANTPSNWTHVENTTRESVDTAVHGGMYSAMHVGGTKDLGQLISGIVPGKSYELTIWYKVGVVGDGSDCRLWSKWSTDGVNDNTTDKDLLQGPGGGSTDYLDNNGGVWSTYTTTVTAPAGANEFYFEVRTYSGATVYYDDFSFVDLSAIDLTASDDPSILKTTLGTAEEGATIVLKRGMTYDFTSTVLTKSIRIMSEAGEGDPAILDMGGSSLDVAQDSVLDFIILNDLEFKGDISAGYLMNSSKSGAGIHKFILDNVYIHNLRGVFRCKTGTNNFDLFKINNSVIDSIGGYGVMIMDNADAYCADVEISNSTFSSVAQLLRWKSTADVNSVVISSCTFQDTPNDGYIIRLDADSVLNGVIIEKSIFGKSNNKLKSTANSNSRVSVKAYDSYMTSDCTLKSSDFESAPMAYTGADANLFADAANKDFTINDKYFEGRYTAGDPRWYMQPPALKHSYTFEDADTVIDKVGSVNGTLEGNAVTADGALVLDENGDYVSFDGAALDLNSYSAITMEYNFMGSETANTGWNWTGYFGGDAGANAFYTSLGHWNTEMRTTYSGQEIFRNDVYHNDGKLHTIVTVLTTDSLLLYRDGVRYDQRAITDGFTIDPTNAFLGKGFWNDATWQGSIYEFNIYDGELDAQTISDNAYAFLSPSDARLAELSSADGELIPTYDPYAGVTTMVLSVAEGTTNVNIAAVPMTDGAAVTGAGDVAIEGTVDTIEVKVVSVDKSDSIIYTIYTMVVNNDCYTPTYTELENLVSDPELTMISNFGGWGNRSVMYGPDAYCGASSGMIVGNNGGSIDLLNTASLLKPNTTYLVKAMVYAAGSGQCQIGIGGDILNPNPMEVRSTLNDQWEEISFTFTTQGTVPGGAVIYFNNYGLSNELCYIDNWELYAVPPYTLAFVTKTTSAYDVAVIDSIKAQGDYLVTTFVPDGGEGVITMDDATALSDYDVVVIGRNIGSDKVGAAKDAWDEVTAPVLCMNMYGIRSNSGRAFWTPTQVANNITVNADTVLKAQIVKPTDAVFDGITETTIDYWDGMFSIFAPDTEGDDAGNGELLMTSTINEPLFMRWEKNVEFYPGAGHAPKGDRTYLGNGNDNTEVVYFGFTEVGKTIFFNELERMASGEPVVIERAKKVAYVTESKTMAETAAQPDADPIVTMLMEDE
ncbi:DUF5123 domain-containing protein, partial [Saccharicrinis sp. FJH54]|uniref:DUF5123 domain-containing protein n=1 Tax=Saccharicrinis sp. FJH54 TaxID=3344665 RepID=UPI0035D46611